MSDLHDNYFHIMFNESELNDFAKDFRKAILHASQIENIAKRVIEVARNSIVLRCCGKYGHITEDEIAFESDGAHTNLVSAIADYAMDFIYTLHGWSLPYPHRDIIEAIRVHDLPENIFGDIPDNGQINYDWKHQQEARYYGRLFKLYPTRQKSLVRNVKAILHEMEHHSTGIGRIVYLSDKIAAIIAALCYDDCMVYPVSSPEDATISDAAREAMDLCDEQNLFAFAKQPDGSTIVKPQYPCSELWTIDYLIGRRLINFDNTGFFTGLLVMVTLILKDGWYNWRLREYPYDLTEEALRYDAEDLPGEQLPDPDGVPIEQTPDNTENMSTEPLPDADGTET